MFLLLLLVLLDPYAHEEVSRMRRKSGFRHGRHAAMMPVLHSALNRQIVSHMPLQKVFSPGKKGTYTVQIVRLVESQRKSPVLP